MATSRLFYAGLTIPPAKSVNAAASQRTLTTAADRATIPVVYGSDIVPGLLVNVLLSDTTVGHMLVQVLWCHACDDVDDILLNGLALPSGATVTHYTGAQFTADSNLVAAFAAQSITYSDTLAGFAYSVVSMPVIEFTGQLQFTAVIRGRKLYDPRKDSTAGGSGAHRLATPSTWEWSDNPSLATADWLASDDYGADESVLWSSVGAAANANDALVGGEKRRLIGLTISEQATTTDTAEAMRVYAGCWLVATASGIRLVPDADSSPVATYAHASGNIADITPLQLPDRSAMPTVVEVVYSDISGAERAEDSARASLPGAGSTLPWRFSRVRLPGIQRYSQAMREAIERLNKLTLEGLATTLEVFDIGIRHERGDIIAVTHPVGLASETMRVVFVDMPLPGRWRLDLMRHDPLSYSDDVQTAPGGYVSERVLGPGPASDVVDATISISEGVMTIAWKPCPDKFYEATELRLVEGNWGSNTVVPEWRGKQSQVTYLVTAPGVTYTYHLRHISAGRPSANTTTVTITTTNAMLPGGNVVASATPFAMVVQADSNGVVTDDFTTANTEVELSILVNGVESINAWTLTPVATLAGFTWTITGSTFELTDAPDDFQLTDITITATRTGYADQTIRLLVAMQRAAGAGTAHRMVITPRNATLTADQNGVVQDWSPAQADITVWNSGGTDVTDEYTFTKADTNVVSALSGTYNNHLTVTGWDPAAASTAWGNTVLQMPLDGDAVDVSQYQRQSIQTFAGVTFVGGGFNGRANFDFSSHNARITVGPYAGFLVPAGTPWSIRCRVEFNALTTNVGEEHYLCGNAYKGIVVTKASGAGQYTWRAYWIGNGNTFAAQSVAATINTGQIYLVEASYGADGHLRLFLDGVQVGITSSTNTTTPDYVDTTSQTFYVGAAQPAGNYNTALNGKLDDLRYVVGAGGSNNAYTPETYPLPVGAYVTAGHVDITAAHATLPDLTDRFSVSTVTVAAAPISSGISPSTITLQADWQGVVASFSGASAVLSIMVNGTEEADTWSIISTTSHASITYSKSGRTITLTGFPSSETNGYIDFNCSKAGRASQVIRLGIVKVSAAQPIVIASAPSPVIVAGATDGTVPSANLPVAVSAVAREGATDVTSSYSWSVSATSGITVTNTGAAASITAMNTGTDSGTLTWTGTRASWPTLTCPATVTKTRTALPSGAVVAQMVAYAAYAGSTDPVEAKIKYTTDGRILIWDAGGSSYTHVGNWYNPTTTNIGNTHYIRMTAGTVPGDAAGPFNAWTVLSSDREYTMDNPATTGASTMTATALISTSSTGASIAGQGPVTLTAEKFGS